MKSKLTLVVSSFSLSALPIISEPEMLLVSILGAMLVYSIESMMLLHIKMPALNNSGSSLFSQIGLFPSFFFFFSARTHMLAQSLSLGLQPVKAHAG